MSSRKLSVGETVLLPKAGLQQIRDALKNQGFRTVGPQPRDGAVVYDDLDSVAQLPIGLLDEQDGGHYRLREDEDAGYFDYVVGPHSL